MRKLLLASAVSAAFSMPLTVSAQTAPPPASDKPAESPPISILGMDFTGYIDVAYSGLSGRGAFTNQPCCSPAGTNRVFDYKRNSLDVHQVGLTLAAQPKEGLGGLVNVTLGKDADVIAAYPTGPSNGDSCNLATGQGNTRSCKKTGYDITQSFVQYATGPATFIGGKYVTLAGAEVINSTGNTNFSRSILFGFAIPFTHTGVRASYGLSDTLTLIGGINNGWDDVKDTNSAKTVELGVSYTPVKEVVLAAQGYFGKERVNGLVNTGPEGTRNLIDVVATYNATDKLTLIVNYDYGTQANAVNGGSSAKWSGVAGYANYQFNDQWRISLRGEYFDDRDGYRTQVAQKWKEATLTVGYALNKNLELRGEVRVDRSNVPSFIDSNNVASSNNQRSVAAQAIYKF